MDKEQLVQLITDIVVEELNALAVTNSTIGADGKSQETSGDGPLTIERPRLIPVGLSNRHLHISQSDLEALFGKGYALTQLRDLTQPGQYACHETVDLVGPKRTLYGVRILGPVRPATQIELSLTDGYLLGLHPPVRVSGDIEGTPGIHIIGPKGAIKIDKGVIIAARHIHMLTEDAAQFGVEDQQVITVRVTGPRKVIFDEVVVRVSPKFFTELHLDVDEGNAAYVKTGDQVEIITDLCLEMCTPWCQLQHWNGNPRHPQLNNPNYRSEELKVK